MEESPADLRGLSSSLAIAWPLIIYMTGIAGWIKFWLMTWLGYHFWMSTFTIVQHTAPHIPFNNSEEWNAAQAQLNGTVHCDFPRWIERLCHDINVHIPHHISPKIPSYNLRAAQESLYENWGKIHIGFVIFAVVAPPIFFKGKSLAGILPAIDLIGGNALVGIFYFIGFGLFCLESLLSVWVLQQVYMYFRGSGKGTQMRQEAARGAVRAVF